MAPNSGPRWADTEGISSTPAGMVDCVDRKMVIKEIRTSTAASEDLWLTAVRNERSQIESKARPWATEARRPTIHMIDASID